VGPIFDGAGALYKWLTYTKEIVIALFSE